MIAESAKCGWKDSEAEWADSGSWSRDIYS